MVFCAYFRCLLAGGCVFGFFKRSHQPTFAAGGISGVNDAFAGCFIQRFVRHPSSCFCFFQITTLNKLPCFADISPGSGMIPTIVCRAFDSLPNTLFGRFDISQFFKFLRFAFSLLRET